MLRSISMYVGVRVSNETDRILGKLKKCDELINIIWMTIRFIIQRRVDRLFTDRRRGAILLKPPLRFY